jgi:polyhydroxybutyrate depolymerase
MIAALFASLLLAPAPQTEPLMVDGVQRTAIVHAPANPPAEGSAGAPLVLMLHGHGGSARGVANRFKIQDLWPEAVVIYLQGLTGTPGITDPEGTRTGWQKNPGDAADRDVKFVDAVLKLAREKYRADPKRTYAMGHSNGARFTGVLWKMRGAEFAAFGIGCGPVTQLLTGSPVRPAFIIAGEKDPLVPIAGMRASIDAARKLLETDAARSKTDGLLRTEQGKNGIELATYVHPGGHAWPPEATPLVVEFFKRHPGTRGAGDGR